MLKTDSSVLRRRSGLRLGGFWPRGEDCPMVFCQVEGEEESGHIGSRQSAKVDSQSKFNPTEAGKIVSKTYNFNHYWLHLGKLEFVVVKAPSKAVFLLMPYAGGHSAEVSLQVQCTQQSNSHSHTILCSERSDH